MRTVPEVLAAGSFLILTGCVKAGFQAGPLCQPDFPYQQGWLGGDAASSAVSQREDGAVEETLWFFGDTFVGEPGATDRTRAAFVNNTVARSRCDAEEGWSIEYGWLHEGGEARAVFVPPAREGEFYWPLAASSVRGVPYVLLSRTVLTELEGVSTFAVVGTDVARINNPSAGVANWEIQYSGLLDDATIIPASAAIVFEEHLYIIGYIQGRPDLTIPRFMSRISIAALERFDGDLSDSLEIWTGAAWVVGGTPKVLMEDAATEMGIRELPGGCGWMVSYMSPVQPGEVGFSETIYVRTARSLEGPWSERRLLTRVAEMSDTDVNGFVPGTVCYAAKLHPQFGSDTRISLTYVCSVPSGRPDQAGVIRQSMNLYVPRVLSLPLPTPGNHGGIVRECPWLIE